MPIGGPVSSELGILDVTANGGINPATGLPWQGRDKYRFVFGSSVGLSTRSSSYLYYNDFVQDLADASALGIGSANGLQWRALASTHYRSAKDNTFTAQGSGESVWLLNGTEFIAADYADMWDGSINTAADVSETGGAPYDGGSWWSVWSGWLDRRG